MVDSEWLENVAAVKPLKAAEKMSRNVRLVIYAYLDTRDILFEVARLCRKERQRMIESHIANKGRSWTFYLDRYYPASAEDRLFDRLQYMLSVVFEVNLNVSTSHGVESLMMFIKEMPDKFEKNAINLVMSRLGLTQAEVLARTVKQARPGLNFRTLTVNEEPLSSERA